MLTVCQYAPEPTEPIPEEETSSNLIIKVTQGPQSWLPDVKILREWHRELSHLIDGFVTKWSSSKIKLSERLKFNPSAPI